MHGWKFEPEGSLKIMLATNGRVINSNNFLFQPVEWRIGNTIRLHHYDPHSSPEEEYISQNNNKVTLTNVFIPLDIYYKYLLFK